MPTHIYKNPETYSKNNNLQYHFAMDVIQKAEILPTDRVLDLGCGDGRITFEIAKIANQGCVVGTDISEKMIEHAILTYGAQSNLGFLKMDMSRNIFRNQFDVITSFNSLHWVKDQISALKGIAQAAIPNAKIILLLSHKQSAYHHVLNYLCSTPKWSTYFKDYQNPRSFFTKEQYNDFLLQAGFSVTSLQEREMTYQFDSINELKAFLAASMANIKCVPIDLKDEFLEDFYFEYLKRSPGKNHNQIPLSFWCLEVFALKTSAQPMEKIKENDFVKIFKSKL